MSLNLFGLFKYLKILRLILGRLKPYFSLFWVWVFIYMSLCVLGSLPGLGVMALSSPQSSVTSVASVEWAAGWGVSKVSVIQCHHVTIPGHMGHGTQFTGDSPGQGSARYGTLSLSHCVALSSQQRGGGIKLSHNGFFALINSQILQ